MYGKTVMNWNVPGIKGGSPEKFTNVLVDAGMEGVCLKVADGPLVQKPSAWPKWGENVKAELIAALREAGIRIHFWHFVYGNDPQGEAAIAAEQCERFKPDTYSWNAEGAFEAQTNAVANARLISSSLRNAFPDLSQSLLWWAFPKSPKTGKEWHPVKVANAFLETVDTISPMMYWQGKGAVDAVNYLENSIFVWRTITEKPLIPVGRAYTGTGGECDPAGIIAFGDAVINLAETKNLLGNSWWSMDNAYPNSSWWQAIAATQKWDLPIMLGTKEILRRLVAAHPELFPEFQL